MNAHGALQARVADRLTTAIVALVPLSIWPGSMPIVLVLVLLTVVGAGLGTRVPGVHRVPAEPPSRAPQMGVAPARRIFFRACFR